MATVPAAPHTAVAPDDPAVVPTAPVAMPSTMASPLLRVFLSQIVEFQRRRLRTGTRDRRRKLLARCSDTDRATEENDQKGATIHTTLRDREYGYTPTLIALFRCCCPLIPGQALWG